MLKIIAAIGKNNELGSAGRLPSWKLKTDMERFKKLTEGQTVVMGRKTFESLPPKFRPLPNRENVVLTRDKDWKSEGVEVVSELDLTLLRGSGRQAEGVWIIGGGNIYQQFLHLADELHITHVDGEFPADTFFPYIDEDLWVPKHEEEIPQDGENSHRSVYVVYKKI
jgi:dihydrofolate reductase